MKHLQSNPSKMTILGKAILSPREVLQYSLYSTVLYSTVWYCYRIIYL